MTATRATLRGFAGVAESLIEGAQERVIAAGDERGHVERRRAPGRAHPRCGAGRELATVAIERARRRPGRRWRDDPGGRARASRRATCAPWSARCRGRCAAGRPAPARIGLGLRSTCRSRHRRSARRRSSQRMWLRRSRVSGPVGGAWSSRLPLHAEHLQQLAPARHQRGQRLSGGIGHRPGAGSTRAPKTARTAGIDGVGLRGAPERLGKGADLARIDDRDRQRRRRTGRHERAFVAARGFDDDDCRRQRRASAGTSARAPPASCHWSTARRWDRPAIGNSRLLTSIPTLTADPWHVLLVAAAPDLMRVRARGPVNCPG